ncbi:MAG: hypothetical protein HYU78_15665 [Rhodocyclales bacterium]|nr:hypothetical protein [Rhodocyclales bacterium]
MSHARRSPCPPWRHLLTTLLAGTGLLGAPACGLADEGLGRLFFSPEKREQLDRQRAHNTLESRTTGEDPQVLINGQVRRSSGRHTTWINGQPQNDNETVAGVVARPDPRAPARVVVEAGSAVQAPVTVGDALNRGTLETSSALGDGRIVVHPRGASKSR